MLRDKFDPFQNGRTTALGMSSSFWFTEMKQRQKRLYQNCPLRNWHIPPSEKDNHLQTYLGRGCVTSQDGIFNSVFFCWYSGIWTGRRPVVEGSFFFTGVTSATPGLLKGDAAVCPGNIIIDDHCWPCETGKLYRKEKSFQKTSMERLVSGYYFRDAMAFL